MPSYAHKTRATGAACRIDKRNDSGYTHKIPRRRLSVDSNGRNFTRTNLGGIGAAVPERFVPGPDAEIVDLSAGGACIRTSRTLEPGSRITFALNLKDIGEEVAFEAEVRWVRREDSKNLIGIKFLG